MSEIIYILSDVFHAIADPIIALVSQWGYPGIFFLMFLESSFFPFPSEAVMIPAGILAAKGEMNVYLVIAFGIFGSIAGAWFNYMLALKFGRSFLLKAPIIKFFVTEEKLHRVEVFFEKHGPISTFIGRLIPLVRQYISFPAGLAKMDPLKFTIYTAAGAGIWMVILTMLGYLIGDNQELIEQYLSQIIKGLLLLMIAGVIVYIFYAWRNKSK